MGSTGDILIMNQAVQVTQDFHNLLVEERIYLCLMAYVNWSVAETER